MEIYMSILHILLTVVMISVLALLHELGHFMTARIFRVPVKEFAVGMGPKLFSRRFGKSGTLYSLRALPIGGFVSMVGEDEESEDENALNNKPVWQRMIITVAGSLMNIITGFAIMLIVVLLSVRIGETTVSGFAEGAITEKSGLMVGDEILSVDGNSVHVAGELSYEIMRNATRPIDLIVRRGGEVITLEDVHFPTETVEGVKFGVADFFCSPVEKNFPNVMKQTFFRSVSAVKMVWESLVDLIGGRYSVEHVSGPVGVATAVSDAAKSGVSDFLFLTVVVAMNLGVFNLLPIPALDGGRLFFQLVELVRGKPVKPQVEGYIHFVGIVLLMLLMVVVTFKDIINLFV